jgi:integration host factor subunit alpha
MTLRKDHIINKIASSNGFQKKAAGQFLESLLELMKVTLESGEPIMVSRFGKFQVKDKNNRRGRKLRYERCREVRAQFQVSGYKRRFS